MTTTKKDNIAFFNDKAVHTGISSFTWKCNYCETENCCNEWPDIGRWIMISEVNAEQQEITIWHNPIVVEARKVPILLCGQCILQFLADEITMCKCGRDVLTKSKYSKELFCRVCKI